MFKVLRGPKASLCAYRDGKLRSLHSEGWFWQTGPFLSTEWAHHSAARGKRAAGEDRKEHG